jgi:hypothetical protein
MATHLVTLDNFSATEVNLLRRHRSQLDQINDLRNTDAQETLG